MGKFSAKKEKKSNHWGYSQAWLQLKIYFSVFILSEEYRNCSPSSVYAYQKVTAFCKLFKNPPKLLSYLPVFSHQNSFIFISFFTFLYCPSHLSHLWMAYNKNMSQNVKNIEQKLLKGPIHYYSIQIFISRNDNNYCNSPYRP